MDDTVNGATNPLSAAEPTRLAAVRDLSLLFTPREDIFQSVAGLACRLFRVPICLVSLLDEEVQWFKAAIGFAPQAIPRASSFCDHAIQSEGVFVVEDAANDSRFSGNTLVTGEPFIRFYAGTPLRVASSHAVGTLCVIDTSPRVFSADERSQLVVLAAMVARLLDSTSNAARIDRLNRQLSAETRKLTRQNGEFELMSSLASIGMWSFDPVSMETTWSNEVRRIHEAPDGYTPDFERAIAFFPEPGRARLVQGLETCFATGEPWEDEFPLVTAKGNHRFIRICARVDSVNGKPAMLHGAVQDVTDLVAAREALAASSRRLELATESASIGLWDWDVKADRLWTYPAWWRYLGYEGAQGPRCEAESDTVVHPDDLPALVASRKAFLAGETSRFVNDFRHRDGKGGWRWVLSSGRATATDPDGSIARVSGVYVDIHERKQAADRVNHAARHDLMTGLLNRAELKRAVTELLDRRGGPHDDVSLLALDLDRFKFVNDSYGHAAGDAVLKAVAGRLRHTLREGDMVARLGGDEFAVVLCNDGANRGEAEAVAKRILSALAAPFSFDGRDLRISASIGIAASLSHGASFDTLLRNADAALYRVKLSGKNGFRFFDAEIERSARARRELESDLRQALARNELALYFQPQVALGSGHIRAAEALLRWHHPAHGTVMPDRFIQLAEESGLIVPIGEWVIAEATRQAALWPDGVIVSINLSPTQLGRTDLVSCVTRALADTGLSPGRLEIEVTESVFLNEANAPLSDLIALHDMGVRLALDDFGTGFASLSYLKKLPFDRIKIDRSFIRDLSTNAQSGAIICAVVNLARSLGIDNTAEGIETAEQASMLRAAGCGYGQGYFFGRPVPPEQLFGPVAKGSAAA